MNNSTLVPVSPSNHSHNHSYNQSYNHSRNRSWLEDDGTTDWLYISSFIWSILALVVCAGVFLTHPRLRASKSCLLTLNLLLSVLMNEVFRSVSIIYHDAIGNPHHFTFGLHYCRFSILAWSFSFTLQSFSVLLVTIDGCLQTFSSPRWNSLLARNGLFWFIISSPVSLALVATLLLILPVSPTVGQIMEIHGREFCFLSIIVRSIRGWLTAYSLVAVILPATASFIIASILAIRMCCHLSSYAAFDNELSSTSRGGATQMLQIVIATFILNLLFVTFSGPYAWSRILLNYDLLEDSKNAFRVYWCLLPVVWLTLQPEIWSQMAGCVWRCCHHGPLDVLTGWGDRMKGSGSGRRQSEIREYTVDYKQDETFDQVPI